MMGFQLITEEEAAEIMKISPKTLGDLRRKGQGPAYIKIGGSIRYEKNHLIKWVENQFEMQKEEQS